LVGNVVLYKGKAYWYYMSGYQEPDGSVINELTVKSPKILSGEKASLLDVDACYIRYKK
jgi:hypothetical protein